MLPVKDLESRLAQVCISGPLVRCFVLTQTGQNQCLMHIHFSSPDPKAHR